MKNEICITTFHQGWTDIILCIGIVFNNIKKFKKVILIARDDAKDLLNFIFNNISNIEIKYISRDGEYQHRYQKYITNLVNKLDNVKLSLHGGHFVKKKYNKIYDLGGAEYFYEIFSTNYINYKNNINLFNINRNSELENLYYKKVKEKVGDDYIIINEDPKRELYINKSKIKSNLSIYNINASTNIVFDAILALENAKEIHTISTFWSLIILNLSKKYNLFVDIPIYFHSYVRNKRYDYLYKESDWTFIN